MTDGFVFSSGSVTAGHPDKLCDQISDAVVDHHLRTDPFCRISAECAVAKGILFLAVRQSSNASVDAADVARQVIDRVGYREPPFAAKTCSIMTTIDEALEGRATADERGMTGEEIEAVTATQQGSLFGYACRQSPDMLPLPIWLAHRLARRLSALPSEADCGYLSPDGQVQVAVEYRGRVPARIHGITLVTAVRDRATATEDRLCRDLMERVVAPAFADQPIAPDDQTRILVNPGGTPLIGGPNNHAGLTGRKTAIDTYGEYVRNSSAAMSGKGPDRIDRIGAYAARHAAKNVVAAELAEECEVQLSYAIGQTRPVSVHVDSFGSGVISDREILERVRRTFDFRPAAITARFDLRRQPERAGGPFYERLAAFGQIGRSDIALPWEDTGMADRLV